MQQSAQGGWPGYESMNGGMAATGAAPVEAMELEAATAAAMEAAAAAAAAVAAAAAGTAVEQQDAAANGDADAADAADAAADAEEEGEDGGSMEPAQPSKAEQMPYAAIREAAAVNQAADGAADEAMRAVAASQQVLQLLMNPQPDMMATAMMGMEDDAGNSSQHTSGRARRRASQAYLEQAAAAGLMGYHSMYGSGSSGGRPNKGLRHFSMKVCEKVESKGTTSYNEVADELVAELKDGGLDDGICYDEKNIRRRVYDAINVLMALDIIAKEKKAIIWRGFPTQRSAAQQVGRLQNEQLAAMSEVGRKAQYLADLVEQQRALKHLLDRNSGQPEGGSSTGTALHLPFILVQSKHDATVEVQISPDMQDVQFNFFNYPFEIHDDALVLRKMLEYDNMQKLGAMGLDGTMPMSIDGQMLTPEQLAYMQQQQAAMAAAAAAGQTY